MMTPTSSGKRKASSRRLSNQTKQDDDGFFDTETPKKPRRTSSDSSMLTDESFNDSITSSPKLLSLAKTFQDSVHGPIMLEPLLVTIIDTPQFQRLRDLKQLGVAYWVYPGACHNRFEHCIGTSHLCAQMLSTAKTLQKNFYDDPIEITDKEIQCVQIAGLIHDLGHGPFSHLFDGEFIPKVKPESEWTHEKASCDLFDHMIKTNQNVSEMFTKNGIGEVEIKMIKDMIIGGPEQKDEVPTTQYCGRQLKKRFLYEIVSNKATGIDCDKFDYFARDTHHVGIQNCFDFKRFFKNIRILPIGDELRICARDKEESNLYDLFHIRWTLHRQVYQHKTVKLIGELLVQAMLHADETFDFSSSISNMERYTYLTDSIFYEILRSKDESKNMRRAKECIRRIQSREVYQFCGEFNPKIVEQPDGKELTSSQRKLSRGEIQDGVASCHDDVSEDDVHVGECYFSFGKKDQNPLANMHFFGKDGRLKKPQLNDMSSMVPKKFEEKYFRIYCTNPDKVDAVKRAFAIWCKENGYITTFEYE